MLRRCTTLNRRTPIGFRAIRKTVFKTIRTLKSRREIAREYRKLRRNRTRRTLYA